MRFELTRAWLEHGAANLEDLCPAIGMHEIHVIKIMNGKMDPDEWTKEVFAELFKKSVKELFPNG